ncbi:MAG: hypothetical protein ACYC91_09430 [Solirubrobacteraceae bacterium]
MGVPRRHGRSASVARARIVGAGASVVPFLFAALMMDPAVATARRLAIKPPHGRAFVPVVGDWEGVGAGFSASFELVYKPWYATRYRLSPYGFENFAVLLPDTCPVSPFSYAEESIQPGAFMPLSAGGAFPSGSSC